MAPARPVVATSAEGVAEILGPLATTPARQLVNLADAGAFVDAVVRLASDPTLAEKVGIANRRRVEREFTMERMVQRYCDLYRELL
jgi:glycosyltransferase involved in cell wall biosynthesis